MPFFLLVECLCLGIITNEGTTKCSRCDEEFSDYEKFEVHAESKECIKKEGVRCDECSSVLKTKKSLKRHMLSKHTQHKYVIVFSLSNYISRFV